MLRGLFMTMLAAAPALAQVEQWRATQAFDRSGTGMAEFDQSGSVVIAANPTAASLLVRRLSASGSELWRWSTNLPPIATESPTQSFIALDGRVVIATSRSTAVGPAEIVTGGVLMFDASGNKLWESYHADGTVSSFAPEMAVDSHGDLYVSWKPASTDEAGLIRKYSSAGAVLWDEPLPEVRRVSELLSANDGVVAIGPAITKVSAAGTVAWQQTAASLGLNDAQFVDGAVSSDGSIVVAGSSFEGSRKVATVVTLRSDGRLRWTRNYGAVPRVNLDQWSGSAVAVDEQQNVYLAVSPTSLFRAGIPLVVRYTPEGERGWVSQILGLDFTEPYLTAISHRNGALYVQGEGTRGSERLCPSSNRKTGGRDVFTARLRSVDGNVEWTTLLDLEDLEDRSLASPALTDLGVSFAFQSLGCDESTVTVVNHNHTRKAGAPSITTQPRDAAGYQPLTYQVTAAGEGLEYQWFSYDGLGNPSAIAGATGPVLNRPDSTSLDSSFAVRVTNGAGTIWSRQAQVVVEQSLGLPQPFLDNLSTSFLIDLGLYYDLQASEDLVNWQFVSSHADFSGFVVAELPYDRGRKARFFRVRERH